MIAPVEVQGDRRARAAGEKHRERSRSPRTRFFLYLPDQSKVELQRIALSSGSDGCDYYLTIDDYESVRNAATKRVDPRGVVPKKQPMKHNEFQRGVHAAADVARSYDSASTHPYRLDDCILAKLNVRRQKPRRNQQVQRNERDAWLSGYAVALAEMHRRLLNGNDSTGVCEVARVAGLTLKAARAVGVSVFDLKELKRAGVR